MEGEKSEVGGEEQEQPKLRSWARNRQATSPASSPSSEGAGERSWVKMRQQGKVNSLEDLATKYHRMKQQQEEESQTKSEASNTQDKGAETQGKVVVVAHPTPISHDRKREEPDKSSIKKNKKEKKEKKEKGDKKKRKLSHDKEREEALELSEAENQEIEAEIKRLERQAEEVQKQIEEEEQEETNDSEKMQNDQGITIEDAADTTPVKAHEEDEEVISRLCKIFTTDEDEQIRKIVVDTFISCEQNEDAARIVLLEAKKRFDQEVEEGGEFDVYYTCNNCDRDIEPGEFRYHCTKCEDYDLCSSCLSKHNTSGPIHEKDHFFEEIVVESDDSEDYSSDSDDEHHHDHHKCNCGSGKEETKKDDADSSVQDECEQLLFEDVVERPVAHLDPRRLEEQKATDWKKIALGVVVVGGLTAAGYIVFKRFSTK